MKTMRPILVLLILAIGLVLPARAQQDTVNLHFRLTVQGVPCPNDTYWGFFGAPNTDDVNYVQLTDPESDGVYTGTGTHSGGRLVVQIIQGTGSERITSELFGGAELVVPGEPTQVIRDFGMEQPDLPGFVPHLIVTEDMVFEASVMRCPDGLPDTGGHDGLVAPLAGAVLLLTVGIYLRRRMWRHV